MRNSVYSIETIGNFAPVKVTGTRVEMEKHLRNLRNYFKAEGYRLASDRKFKGMLTISNGEDRVLIVMKKDGYTIEKKLRF